MAKIDVTGYSAEPNFSCQPELVLFLATRFTQPMSRSNTPPIHQFGDAQLGHWIIVHSLIVHNFFVHRFIVHIAVVHMLIYKEFST